MITTLLLAASLTSSRILIGCSDKTDATVDAAADTSTPSDAGATDSPATGDGPVVDLDAPIPHPGDDAGVGYLRLAQVNQNLGSVDFCIGEGDFSKATPALAAFATTGVAFSEVSRYVAASTRATALRIVAAGATNCATGVGSDAVLKVNDSSYTTVVALGTNASSVSLTAMTDLPPSAGFQDAATDPLLRFVHAAVGIGTVNFGSNSLLEGNFTPDFPNVGYGKTAQPPATDTLGYRRIGYMTAMSASAPAATVDLARWSAINYGEPAVGSLFLVNDPDPAKMRLLFCKHDAQIPKSGAKNPSCELLARDP